MNASDMLWSEFQACIKLGIDPDVYFKKERHMRALITGGSIADNAINSMRQYDMEQEQERKK